MRFVCVVIVLLNLTLVSSLCAETEGEKIAEHKDEDVFDLGRIVITPSRLYQEYGQVSRATNLITEEEIQDKNPVRAGDLLEDLPSAQVMEYGSLGHSSSIRLRGLLQARPLFL